MILAAALLLLVAVGLLVAGLVQGSSTLQWASFAASALAALLLVVSEVRQRRAERQPGRADGGGSHRGTAVTAASASPLVPPRHDTAAETDHGEPLRRVSPPPVPPSSPSIPRVAGPPSGSGLGDLAAGPTGGPQSDGAGLRAPLGPRSAEGPAVPTPGEPPIEDVEFTDQLMVIDLTDEVLVVDEHPRYHLPRCPHVSGLETIPLPLAEARTDGFTPCATCAPDHHLAQRERARRT